jgi:hypothetical protein
LALALAAATAVAAVWLPSRPAAAETPWEPLCDDEYTVDATCGLRGDDGPEGRDGAGGSAEPGGFVECVDAPGGRCSDGNGGWWDQGKRCYPVVAARGPHELPSTWPIATDEALLQLLSVWTSHPDGDGVIMSCRADDGLLLLWWWAPSGDPPPSGLEFEQAAKASAAAGLAAPGLGVSPGGLEDPARPGASGVVGAPVWLWADDPGPGVRSTLVKNVDVRRQHVRVEATLSEVVYDMGDGRTVACGPGTEPAGATAGPSPDCGHAYTEPGRYAVTADTVFRVEWWAKGGRHGVFPLTLTRSGVYVVAEA